MSTRNTHLSLDLDIKALNPRNICPRWLNIAVVFSGDRLSLTVNELDLEDPADVLVISEFTSEKVSYPKKPVRVKTYALSGIRRRLTVTTQGFFKLNFRTDSSVAKKGFRLEVTVAGPRCGGEVRTNGDYITSPKYPLNYPANSTCDWRIEAPSTQYDIDISVVSINLTKSEYCTDRLILLQRNKPHTILCGHNASRDSVTLTGSTASILFRTSMDEKGGKGFALQIFFVKRRPPQTTQCGIQTSRFRFADAVREKIVGGTRAAIENFPWMALLETRSTFCTANLISNLWVWYECMHAYRSKMGISLIIAGRNESSTRIWIQY